MLHKTSSIHALLLAGLMLGAAGSQASNPVGSHYRPQHQDRQYNAPRHLDRQESYGRHHNRYRYYGHSPYYNYRPHAYAYRHGYRRYHYSPYRYRGYRGHGGHYRGHGGLFFRLY